MFKDEGNTPVQDNHASWFGRYKFYHEAKKTKKGAQTPNKKDKKHHKEIIRKDSEVYQARPSVFSSCQSETDTHRRQRTQQIKSTRETNFSGGKPLRSKISRKER